MRKDAVKLTGAAVVLATKMSVASFVWRAVPETPDAPANWIIGVILKSRLAALISPFV